MQIFFKTALFSLAAKINIQPGGPPSLLAHCEDIPMNSGLVVR